MQAETRNIYVLRFGASYIRDFVVSKRVVASYHDCAISNATYIGIHRYALQLIQI